jgi:hypothetical protein
VRLDRYCLLDHGNNPQPAAKTLTVCHSHRETITQDLYDTDLLLRLVHDMTIPGRSLDNARGRPIDPQAPVNLAAIATIDPRTQPNPASGDQLVSALRIIEHWAAWTWRHSAYQPPPRPTLAWALDLITTHTTWLLSGHHTIRFAIDMHTTAHQLRAIAGEIQPPIGRHHAPHPRHPDQDCGGRLYPLPAHFGVICIDCGETYDGHTQLRRLGLVLDG